MPLSDKALRNLALALYGKDNPTLLLSWEIKSAEVAQAALLAELRAEMKAFDQHGRGAEICKDKEWCEGYREALDRVYRVLALLSPPPPEPTYKPGDWIVYNGFTTLVVPTPDKRGGIIPGWAKFVSECGPGEIRAATLDEIRSARGENP